MSSGILPKDVDLRQAIAGDPLVVSPESTVAEVIARMSHTWSVCSLQQQPHLSPHSQDLRTSCALVMQDTQLLGIVTERDVVRLSTCGTSIWNKQVSEVMTSPVMTLRLSELTDLHTTLQFFQTHRMRHLPVVDDSGLLIGILAQDTLRQLLQPIDLLRLRKIEEVMTKRVIHATPEMPVLEIAQLMLAHQISCVVIVGSASPKPIPIGIMTEWDIVQFQALGLDLAHIPVGQVMSTPVFTLRPDDSLWSVQQLMQQRRLRRIVISDDKGALQGIITQTTLIQSLNPAEIYKLVELLEERVSQLETEKVEQIQKLNANLAQQVRERTAALEAQVQQAQKELAQRQLVEAKLRQSEARYATLTEMSTVGIFHTDAHGNYRYVNARWSEMAGIPPQAAVGSGWSLALHPEDREWVMEKWHSTVDNSLSFFAEYRFQKPDGTIVWLVAQARTEVDTAKTTIGYIGTVTDITQLKQAELEQQRIAEALHQSNRELKQREEELKQSEATNRAIIQAIPDFLARLDGKGNYLDLLSQGAIQTLVKPEMLPHVSIFDTLPLEQATQRLHFIQQALETGELQIYEHQLEIQGELHFEEVRITPLTQNEVLSIVRDVTLRKQTEESLRLSEATNRVIIQAIPDLLIRIDREGYYRGLLSRGSVKAITPPEGIDKPSIYDVFPRELVDQKLHYVRRALETGELQVFEQRIEMDGEVRYEEVRIAALNPDEALAMVRDITERKQTEIALQNLTQELESRVEARTAALQASEAQLRQFNEQLELTNRELERVTRLKDEFLANMSHELRTPLNAILGMSEGLQEAVFGLINDRQRRAIATIESSGRHLLELINDILDLAKIESGKLELHLQAVSLQCLCDTALTLIKQQAQRKNIHLTIIIPEVEIDFVGDERRLRQVLLNLLTNAVKFTPNGGQVIFRASVRQEAIQFEVEDTGIGIAPEDQCKLFQPFVQIDSSLNRQYDGTGLGLALVQRIVKLHNGDITVRSQLGQGSCFTVSLPTQKLPKQAGIGEFCSSTHPLDASSTFPLNTPLVSSVSTLRLPKNSRQHIILLAEDNEANIDTLTHYLASFGYRIVVAKNGREAISLATTSHPDVILMDIQMAEMNGLEAMQYLKANPDLEKIPIIALTALAMPGDEERCLQAGASRYLAKPLLLRQLVSTIHQLLH